MHNFPAHLLLLQTLELTLLGREPVDIRPEVRAGQIGRSRIAGAPGARTSAAHIGRLAPRMAQGGPPQRGVGARSTARFPLKRGERGPVMLSHKRHWKWRRDLPLLSLKGSESTFFRPSPKSSGGSGARSRRRPRLKGSEGTSTPFQRTGSVLVAAFPRVPTSKLVIGT